MPRASGSRARTRSSVARSSPAVAAPGLGVGPALGGLPVPDTDGAGRCDGGSAAGTAPVCRAAACSRDRPASGGETVLRLARRVRLGAEREADPERRALALSAIDPDVAAVEL